MKIIIPIPEAETSILAISGSIIILEGANKYPGEHFEVVVAAKKSLKQRQIGRYAIRVDANWQDVTEADLIIIPALEGNQRIALTENRDMVEWLKWMHLKKGSEIAGMCTGAYLLAATGFLDGKEASSHWLKIDELRRLFPKVNWQPKHIITDMDGFYTSGGSLSSFNLILYLVEKFVGLEMAVRLSKVYEIDFNRNSQLPFMIFNNQKNHNDEVILAIQAYMEANFQQTFNMETIAKRFHMSRRNLIRRFKLATRNTPKTYLQRLRVEDAKRLFESEAYNVSEVMDAVGYADMNTFRTVFLRFAGCLPSQYKRKFGN